MNALKIVCECGQKYSFDVDAPDGQMPYPVACPVCGIDGTLLANQMLAKSAVSGPRFASAVASVVAPASVQAAPMRVQAPAASVAPPTVERPTRLLPGQIARPQAEQEARAKIFWGDPPEEVVKFLMRQGIAYAEAKAAVDGFFDERARTLRSDGIGKIVTGIGMACVPVAGWAFFAKIGFMPMKLFGLMVMVGIWGLYRILKGTIMVISPRSETGDVASQ